MNYIVTNMAVTSATGEVLIHSVITINRPFWQLQWCEGELMTRHLWRDRRVFVLWFGEYAGRMSVWDTHARNCTHIQTEHQNREARITTQWLNLTKYIYTNDICTLLLYFTLQILSNPLQANIWLLTATFIWHVVTTVDLCVSVVRLFVGTNKPHNGNKNTFLKVNIRFFHCSFSSPLFLFWVSVNLTILIRVTSNKSIIPTCSNWKVTWDKLEKWVYIEGKVHLDLADCW